MTTPITADRLAPVQAQFAAINCELTQFPPEAFLAAVGGVASGLEKGGGHE